MSKQINRDLLSDAIGKIDPDYLDEFERMDADLAKKPPHKKHYLRALLISAACLVIAFALLLGSLPLTYIAFKEPIDSVVSQTVDRVIFGQDGEEDGPKTIPLWVSWGATEAFFNALGAGTEHSAIEAMKHGDSQGLIAELLENLGLFLDRLYQYYLDNKDEIDGVIDELENELGTEIEIESIFDPPIIENPTDPDVVDPPVDTEQIIDPKPPVEDVTDPIEDVTEPPVEDVTDPIEDVTDPPVEYIPPEIFVIYEPMNLKLQQLTDNAGTYYTVCGFHDPEIIVNDLIIPAEVNGIPVKVIGNHAFKNCRDIHTLTLPNSIVSIGDNAFSSCAFETVEIPASVEKINQSAFYGCKKLVSVTFAQGSSLSYIGPHAFSCSALESLELPSSLKNIKEQAFESCSKLVEVVIPASVTTIGYGAFMSCHSLQSVQIAAGGTLNIGPSAFKGCSSLTDLELGGTALIAQNTFENCDALQSVTIPATLTTIGAYAFTDCDVLENVTFVNGMKKLSIHEYAFSNCVSIKEIEFPARLSITQNFILFGCDAIEKITIQNPTGNYSAASFYIENYLYRDHTVLFNGTKKQWQALGLQDVHGMNSTIICSDGYFGVKPE
ncbi:MAG: leucine-rich repeat domain-containing protein [Clostridia bacterium]|nr:leucine-rich repeat domain-containing protein [Clostridia bacterium]